MTQFIIDNKDVIVPCLSALGILLSLAFGGILSWHHKICLEYESRGDVAINILRDRYVQRASTHYSDVVDERKRDKTAVDEIYRRPQQQELIRELAKDLDNQNRVRRLFRWLVWASNASFWSVWGSIVLTLVAIPLLLVGASLLAWAIWGFALGGGFVVFVGSVSMMCVLDGRFFQLVHGIIKPEGE